MVLGKLPVLGRPTIWITVGQGHFYSRLSSLLFALSPSLWETARYRLKYCLKGPLNPKQPTNQHTHVNLEIRVYFQGRNLAILFSTKANT